MPKFQKNEKKNPQKNNNFHGEFFDIMEIYSQKMDLLNEISEKVYQLSRDITSQSKKLIFCLHRNDSHTFFKDKEIDERFSALKENYKKLFSLQNSIEKEKPSNQETEKKDEGKSFFWTHHHKFHFALEEYFEAFTFYFYLFNFFSSDQQNKEKVNLLGTLEDIKKDIHHKDLEIMKIVDPRDYINGIFDLSGELMRYATNIYSSSLSSRTGDSQSSKKDAPSNQNYIFDICVFLQHLLACFYLFSDSLQFSEKMNTLKASVEKVEKLCYSMKITQIESQLISQQISQKNEKN